MGYDTLLLDKRDNFAVITLNRPKANALSLEVMTELGDALSELIADESVGAIVLTGGDGKFFSTPVIAAVNGIALGGGCELCLACHIRIAAEEAKFGQPEINLGIIPGWGGTQRLPRLIGESRAMDWLLTGRVVSAQEAYEAGLLCKVVPASSLMESAEESPGSSPRSRRWPSG